MIENWRVITMTIKIKASNIDLYSLYIAEYVGNIRTKTYY